MMLEGMMMKRTTGVALLAGLLMTAASAFQPVVAQSGKQHYAQITGEATPPIGWVQFCQTEEGRSDCAVSTLRAAQADLDEKRWKQLLSINKDVNRDIEPITDMDHWGVAERWNYPTDGKGDCEDYVLEKRKRLIQAGWPRQALLITVVRDKEGDGHAVLTVITDRGDFVLDNKEQKVLLWLETGYRYVKRQAQESPMRWVGLGNVDTAVRTAAR
jgi:predicted transglutaminase-like cysteine proteinase